jgi:hypothetical protein
MRGAIRSAERSRARPEQGEAAPLAIDRVLTGRECDVAATAPATFPDGKPDQLQARKRLSFGLQFTASYTWSHALDEQSGLGLFYNGNNPLNLRSAYGSAEMLNWLVHEQGIEPHIPVFDKSQRTDGTFSRDDFTYDPVPTVSAVSPRAGPTKGGTTITITGTGFVAGATVLIGQGINPAVAATRVVTEYDVQQLMGGWFRDEGLVSDSDRKSVV